MSEREQMWRDLSKNFPDRWDLPTKIAAALEELGLVESGLNGIKAAEVIQAALAAAPSPAAQLTGEQVKQALVLSGYENWSLEKLTQHLNSLLARPASPSGVQALSFETWWNWFKGGLGGVTPREVSIAVSAWNQAAPSPTDAVATQAASGSVCEKNLARECPEAETLAIGAGDSFAGSQSHQAASERPAEPCSACSDGDSAMEYHDHNYVKPEDLEAAICSEEDWTKLPPAPTQARELETPLSADEQVQEELINLQATIGRLESGDYRSMEELCKWFRQDFEKLRVAITSYASEKVAGLDADVVAQAYLDELTARCGRHYRDAYSVKLEWSIWKVALSKLLRAEVTR